MAISISVPTCHRQKTMPFSICQSGFASLLAKTRCRFSGCQAVPSTAGQYCGYNNCTPPPASSTSHGVVNTPFATAPLLCVLALDWQPVSSASRLLRHCDTATLQRPLLAQCEALRPSSANMYAAPGDATIPTLLLSYPSQPGPFTTTLVL